jgi:HEAT repeat protein
MGQKFHFFISRAGEDSEWAKWIANVIEQAGHTVSLQDFDFKPGHSFIHKMKLALDHADHFIVVLSRHYLAKESTLGELYSGIAADPIGEKRLVIPVRVELCEVPRIIKDLSYIDFVDKDDAKCRKELLDAIRPERIAELVAFPGRAGIANALEESDRMKREKDASLVATAASEELWAGVRELIEKEIAFADQECARISGKSVEEIFVARDFKEWEVTQDSAAESERDLKPSSWFEVTADLQDRRAVVILGDPGYGKTITLLREVQSRCRGALRALEEQRAGWADPGFGVYFHANHLAHGLGPGQETAEFIIGLLATRHHLGLEKVKGWLRTALQSGNLLVAVDALDEVSEGTERTLRDGLQELARVRTPCELLLSARRVGYVGPPVPLAAEWEILPFKRAQLQQATRKWFYNSPKQSREFAGMIKNVPPFGEMLTNPILFMLACQVWEGACKEAARNDQPAPIFNRRCDLYQRAVLWLCSRWIARVEDKPTELQAGAFVPFVQAVAWQLWSQNPRSRLFTVDQLSDAIENVPKHPSLARRRLLDDLRESGILTKIGKDEAGSPYLFLHRTLLEFLVASYVARRAEDAHSPVAWPNFGDAESYVVLWMIAGKLRNPEPLIEKLVEWSQNQLELPREDLPATQSQELARLLADCLFECRPGSIGHDIRHAAWDLVTRGLDRLQRRARDGEWKDVADWGLLFRVLRAVQAHEGVLSRAEDALRLVKEIREAQGKQQPVTAPLDAWLASAYRSSVPAVRWVAVWATGALHDRGNDAIVTKFVANVVEALTKDDSPHVRCIAARALVGLEYPDTFTILRALLDGESHTIAAGAAIGLSRLRTEEARSVLETKARSLLSDYASSRDPLPTAVIGALEDVVAHARIENVSRVLGDPDLADIFVSALKCPLPIIKGTAASALGKMGFRTSWNQVKELVELSDNRDADMRMMRASAAFACDQLCSAIDEPDLGAAADMLQKWLRNAKEIPQVRRPASSGLVKIARRGYATEAMIRDLLSGAQDRDPKVARNCLFALTTLLQPRLVDDLIVLMEHFDGRQRKLVCEVGAIAPTVASTTLVLWVLENEKRVDVLLASLFAIQKICDKIQTSRLVGFPDYVRDLELFRRLGKRCVDLLGHESAVVVSSSIAGLQQLVGLSPFVKGPLNSVREQTKLHARSLSSSSDPDVRATACSTLGALGSEEEIVLLERLQDTEQSEKVLKTCQIAVRSIKGRLRRQR